MMMLLKKRTQMFSIVGLALILAALLGACTAQVPAAPTAPATPSAVPQEETQPAPTRTASPTARPSPAPTLTAAETPLPSSGSSRVSAVDQMEQVYVPAGEFLMGSDDIEAKRDIEGGRAYPEIPQHIVYLDGFWIDKYEVTNAQYARCEAARACETPWSPDSYTDSNYYGRSEFANYPVVWVNWFQAQQYCQWAGRRLPSEAEWEKAARGTDGRKYPWGDEPVSGERANFCDIHCTRDIANVNFDDGYADTAPVGSYPAGASPYGAMDMSGNVWEWTGTMIAPYPYDPNDGRQQPDGIGELAWRGGPWSNGVWWMRSSVRYRSVDWYRWYVLGFRCAASE